MKNKTQFTINGIKFNLANRFVRTTDFYGKPLKNPKLRMDHAAVSSIIKQYAKQQHPGVTCMTSSDSFSMGNSCSVYLTDERGRHASDEVMSDVKSFGGQFVYGSFNGMIDMYEHNEAGDIMTPEGYEIDASLKYFHVTDRPKHASLPSVYKMLTEMMSEECPYIFGQQDFEGAVKHAKSFGASDKHIAKVVDMIIEDNKK
tara:strand:- start:6773 stop:7375 length:603 start_codon:yes stop_codon:yes gene_type:complete